MNDRALREIAIGLGGRANGYPREIGLRHHRGLRGDGDPRGVARPAGPARAAGRDHRRPLLRRRQAGHRRGPRRRRRDDRAAEGRAQAEPDPDARGPALPDARRPVREHRPRQLVARRRPDRAEARRLRRSPSRASARTWAWRSSSTSSAASGGLRAERGRAGGHRARAQAPRRDRGRPARGARARPRGDRDRRREPAPPPRDRARASACPAWWPSTAARATPTRRSSSCARWRSRAARSRPRSTTASRTAARAPPSWPRRWPTPASSRPSSVRLRGRRLDRGEDPEGRHAGLRRRPTSSSTSDAERKIAQFTEDGLAELPICMAKTHLSLSADPALLQRAGGVHAPGPRHARLHRRGLARAAVRRHPADARAGQDARRRSTSTSTPRGERSGCS